MSDKTLRLALNVARVDAGGNTGEGRYFYSFSRNMSMVEEHDTPIVIRLGDDTPKTFRIADLFTSDAMSQISDVKIAEDGRELTLLNANSRKTLIQFSVLVNDTDRGIPVNCDPQILNRPRT